MGNLNISKLLILISLCLISACGPNKNEEFELRTKCKELGDKLEQKENNGWSPESLVQFLHTVYAHYDPPTNRCLLKDSYIVMRFGNLWEKTIELIDAQSGRVLASSSRIIVTGLDYGKIGDKEVTYDEADVPPA